MAKKFKNAKMKRKAAERNKISRILVTDGLTVSNQCTGWLEEILEKEYSLKDSLQGFINFHVEIPCSIIDNLVYEIIIHNSYDAGEIGVRVIYHRIKLPYPMPAA